MDPLQQVTHWHRRIEAASKVSCPAGCCRELAKLAFQLSKARCMHPQIRETILEGLQKRFKEEYIFASEIFGEMGLQITETFDVVPFPQIPDNPAPVKQEPVTDPALQAVVKKEIEEGIACVAAALRDANAEPVE